MECPYGLVPGDDYLLYAECEDCPHNESGECENAE